MNYMTATPNLSAIMPASAVQFASSLSASISRISRLFMASLEPFAFWKRRGPPLVSEKNNLHNIDQMARKASPAETGSPCLLCYKPVTRKDQLLFLTCSQWHWFHRKCAEDFMKDQHRCPVCHENLSKLASPLGEKKEKGKRQKKRKRWYGKK